MAAHLHDEASERHHVNVEAQHGGQVCRARRQEAQALRWLAAQPWRQTIRTDDVLVTERGSKWRASGIQHPAL